ncbi:minor capsid protein [Evansella tamaricis]|uniref:Minor capsid protein n=1 Tax=Evansella tamaricis TaxID=2069301 RepID=A0ABS6JC40_9BACI|nr:minor capsid protein [Evansella tamaricis]MBU9711063.1 minor capsid protein [Evansella tamaricis]
MDFFDRLIDWIEANHDLFTFIEKSRMSNEGPAIAIRQTPQPPGERFLNGSKVQLFGFQLLVRHSNRVLAMETLDSLYNALDGQKGRDKEGNFIIPSSNNSFYLLKIEGYTSPNYVDTNDRGEELYTAMFVAELYIKKEVEV